MGECICNTCSNLKGVIGENGEVAEYKCEFGFPSEKCQNCDSEDCSETCSRYIEDSEEEKFQTVLCKGCGKELKMSCTDGSDGPIYCVDCYLKGKL